MVEIIATSLGKPIHYVPVTIEDFKTGMQQAGLPASYVWLFGYLFQEVLGNSDNQEISNDVERVLGRPAIHFETYANTTTETGIWNNKVLEIF